MTDESIVHALFHMNEKIERIEWIAAELEKHFGLTGTLYAKEFGNESEDTVIEQHLWEIIDSLNEEVRALTEKNNEVNERCENQAIRNAILEKALETNKESAVHALAYKK